jgi:hypothetical protein
MTTTTSKTTSTAASPWVSSVRTPLLSDEELDALIQAFNRRDPSPVRPNTQVIGLSLLALLVVGLGGWWWL